MSITFITVIENEALDLITLGSHIDSKATVNDVWLIVSDKPTATFIEEEVKNTSVAKIVLHPPAWNENIGFAKSLSRAIYHAKGKPVIVQRIEDLNGETVDH